MKLPEEFLKRMKNMLGDELDDFLASYDQPRYHGLRVNTLKVSVEKFREISPFALEPVPWTREGFYTDSDDRPAKHPYYHAGLYYIQEPSAMVPVSVLNPQPGDRVLDLCAAPGGKSTHIAARLAGEGVLVANDISGERLKGMVRNMEMFGVRNYIILNEIPSRMAERFKGYFDKIVVDAPCSGEGMFRKDPGSVKSWGEFSVERCVQMQKGIIRFAAEMLKPGGALVYSTCTFAPEENEGIIDFLVKLYPEFEPEGIYTVPGAAAGQPQWAGAGEQVSKTIRLWPHRIKGEGHFAALLRKRDGEETGFAEYVPEPPLPEDLEAYRAFFEQTMNIPPFERGLAQHHSRLYVIPPGLPDLKGLKVLRPGWFIGEVRKRRFKPVAPLALALRKEDAGQVLDFAAGSEEVIRYLKGETLNITGERGWRMVCVDGFPLGWAKQLQDMLNNYYPAGWRWMG